MGHDDTATHAVATVLTNIVVVVVVSHIQRIIGCQPEIYELPKTVTENSVYTVAWDGTGESRFDIDLYYCGSFCLEVRAWLFVGTRYYCMFYFQPEPFEERASLSLI